jgi:hypothetical protein
MSIKNGDLYNWFSAVDCMKAKIDKMDFDIAIIGFGAWGVLFVARVKRMEKKALI